jgi:transcriptional regulator with XRE-family HTH domain
MSSIEQTGHRVLVRRRQIGLTQRALAKQTGIPYQVISGVERGLQDVHAQRLGILAKALNVSSDYLLGLAEPEAPV